MIQVDEKKETAAAVAIYNHMAPGYVNGFRLVQRYARTVSAFLRKNVRSGTRVLDVGCGPANISGHLPASVRVTGLDISPEMIKLARKKRPTGRFEVHDYHHPLPQSLGKFDVVMALGTFEFCRDLDRSLANLAKACDHGGRILLTIVERHQPIRKHGPWRRQASAKAPDLGLYLYTQQDVRTACRKAGLKVVARKFQRGWRQRRAMPRYYYYGIWELRKP